MFPSFVLRPVASRFVVDSSRAIYSIGSVAAMVGIPAATLRTWEERYEVVVPVRTEGGHRLYSRDQVEHLRFVADHVADGRSAADAHRLLSEHLAADLASSHAPQAGSTTLLILLAERDVHAADLTEYFLRTEGHQVVVVFEADDVLGHSTDVSADLAVIDLLISGGRGLDLCRELSAAGKPVLAVSTLDTRDEALDAGAGAFLRKPLDPLQLVSTVRDLLRQSAYLRRRR